MTTWLESTRRFQVRLCRSAVLLRNAGAEYPVALSILAVAIAAPILIRLSAAGAQSDIPAHAAMAADMVKSGGWLTYTLWYPLIYFTSSGSSDPALLRELSVFFLVIAVVVKTLLVYYVTWVSTRHRTGSAIVAMLMLVAMPLLDPMRSQDIYLGQVSPNVWHNSTQIFAIPVSLGAFVASVALLRKPNLRRAIFFSVLILASTLAKPNFTLALLPTLGVMLLWKMVAAKVRPGPAIAIVVAAFVPATMLLASQYLRVFGAEGVRKTELTFAPFAVWSTFSVNIPISIGLSIAGPLAVMLVLPKRLRRDSGLVLSWAVLVVAILQLALLAERTQNGSISMEGNFFWGSYSAVFMLFVTSAISLTKTYIAGPDIARHRNALLIATAILTLHAATGFYYLARAGVEDFPVF